MAGRLAYEIMRSETGAAAGKSMIFVHGALARRQNLRSFARLFVEANATDALLVDLRGHGDSPTMAPPHTIEACAQDIQALVSSLDLPPVTRILGHSLGGKVAVCYCYAEKQVDQCVVLDCPPGQYVEFGGDSAARLMSILPSMRVESKTQVAHDLELTHGFSRFVAQWMTTNFKAPGQWAFDLNTVLGLFGSYSSLDLFPRLGVMPTRDVLFVRAEKNKAWSPAVLDQFESAKQRNPRIRLKMARGVGHWLHSEKPTYVRALVDEVE